MNELVQKLSEGDHPIAAGLRESSAAALKERIELGFVHIKFTETAGGIELGITLDPAAVDLTGADFDAGSGVVRLEGTLTLNYERVRCCATIHLATLKR